MQIRILDAAKNMACDRNIIMVFIMVGIWANAAILLKIDDSLSYVDGPEIIVQELQEIDGTLSSLRDQIHCYRRGDTSNSCVGYR